MTTAFDRAFEFTHKEEGGYVLSTLQGEETETYAGIYRKMQPHWPGWVLIDQGDTGSDELKRLHRAFFLSQFWVKSNLEQLPFPLNALVYDFSVNSGSTTAIKKLQLLLMAKPDGVIGAKTAALARSAPSDKLNMRYISARLDFLNDLRMWDTFSEGWSQRIANILNFAAQ